MSDELVKRLQNAYGLVAEWPEKSPDGFMNLLALRNMTPEAVDTIEALTAERDAMRAQVKRADDLADALMAIRARPAGLPSEVFDALAHYRALAQQEGAKG